VIADLNRMWAEAKLAGFERIFRVHLEPVEWTPECELMTPTMKTKRPQMLKHYQKVGMGKKILKFSFVHVCVR
jgi:long-chain acyl-CoA synthetase